MKKKLEGELISIAHRILKLKNKSELAQLHLETQKLYQKLSVLLFVEENFNELKPTIGQAEIEEKIEAAFEKEEASVVEAEPVISPEVFEEVDDVEVPAETNDETETENEVETDEALLEEEAEAADEEHNVQPVEEVVAEEETKENEEVTEEEETETEIEASETESEEEAETEIEVEESAEEEKPEAADDAFKPSFELAFEPKEEKAAPKQITFEDLLGHNYSDPIFEKVGESKPKEEPAKEEESIKKEEIEEKPEVVEEPEEIQVPETKIETPKPTSLNDLHGKTITFGLNDRIGFEKHLFGGSSEDMNRVVSQLSTFDSFQEAQEFIEDMVKPDYNNWEGKDEYSQRFMEIVEKKFS